MGWVDSWGRGEACCCGVVSTVWAEPCALAQRRQKMAAVPVVAKHHQSLIGAGADMINRVRISAAQWAGQGKKTASAHPKPAVTRFLSLPFSFFSDPFKMAILQIGVWFKRLKFGIEGA